MQQLQLMRNVWVMINTNGVCLHSKHSIHKSLGDFGSTDRNMLPRKDSSLKKEHTLSLDMSIPKSKWLSNNYICEVPYTIPSRENINMSVILGRQSILHTSYQRSSGHQTRKQDLRFPSVSVNPFRNHYSFGIISKST